MSGTGRFLEGAAPLLSSELGEAVRDAAKNANATLNGVADATGLTEKVEQSPYGMLAAAAGLGYVLGGGLFTGTTARLVRLGARLAAVPMVRDRLLDGAEAFLDAVLDQTKPNSDSK